MNREEREAYRAGYKAALRESWNETYDAANEFVAACMKADVSKAAAKQIFDQAWSDYRSSGDREYDLFI